MLSKEQALYIRSLANREGHIEPAAVVEAARDESSPIHNMFPWDVQVAAEAHWIDRARELIRFVRVEVIVEHETRVAPFYVSDPSRPPRSQRYVQTTVAARDRELAQKILTDELDRIVNAIRRAQAVAAVLDLGDHLQVMLADVSALKTRAERLANRRRPRAKAPSRKRAA